MASSAVLVIGCGSIGVRHLRNLLTRGDVTVAAHDVSPDAARRVEDLSGSVEFIDDLSTTRYQPDLVIVATPNGMHRAGCLWAFANGADVLCEKPLASTLADGREIVTAGAAAQRAIAVGFSERYRLAVQFIEAEARAGRLGTLVGGRAMVGTYNTLLSAQNPTDRCRTFGSVIVDYVHELDILAALFGEHRRVECMASRLGNRELTANPGLAEILVEYMSGAVVSVHMDYIQHPERRTLEIYGDRRTVHYDFITDTLELYDSASPDVHEVRRFYNNRDEQFLREHEDALSMAHEGTTPRVTGEEALRSLEVAEAALERLRG